ncbi:hypothetical protein [Pseudomonas sp. 6D_7.1_Bac1]|uniref:hypothetical protein n=1 Tax=Pseudomonas sp. 6D_7.1_Bac1 TaxID=2971615 RepID=UPI0021C58418|nr:hypothetical protein [Pseudomonas sp. 6D_7.1_Bac1]MCU1750310.1 hypothetical protein [Pseudomonas sp. 6D_7.1_Bac1]
MTIKEEGFVASGLATLKSGSGVLSDPPILEAGVQIDDGRILKTALAAPNLTVYLPALTNEGGGGTAELWLYRTQADRQLVQVKPLAGLTPADFPLPFDLPTALLPEAPTPETPTEYFAEFKIVDADGNEDHSTSPLPIISDRTPPRQTKSPFARSRPPKVDYLNGPADGVINRAWLTANPGGLRCTVDVDYPMRDGLDTIKFYLLRQSNISAADTPIYEGVVGATGDFTVPADKLALLPANVQLYQVVTQLDRVGNESLPSVAVRDLETRFPPAPTLYPLTVPVTGPDGAIAITLATYNPPGTEIYAVFKRPLNGDPADDITVTLGGLVLATFTLGEGTADIRVLVPYDTCEAIFNNAANEVPTLAHYTLTRDGVDIPSPDTNVILNFTYPGPDLLPPPDLDSENLPPVEVRGITNTLNHLVPGDFGGLVTFLFVKWGLDLGDDLTEQAIVTYYYNGKAMGDQTLDPGQDSAEIKVAFNLIAFEGIGRKEAYVTLEYPGNPNIVRQKVKTQVVFESQQINLLQHTARTYNTDRVVSCPSFDVVAGERLWRVSVPGGQPSLPVGMQVTMNAVGYEDIAKTKPLALAPFKETKPVTNAAAALVFDVPFALIRPMQGPVTPPGTDPIYHYLAVSYEINVGGATIKSPEFVHRINVRNTSSLFCDGLAV